MQNCNTQVIYSRAFSLISIKCPISGFGLLMDPFISTPVGGAIYLCTSEQIDTIG